MDVAQRRQQKAVCPIARAWKYSREEKAMALTNDAIESAKSLLNAGAEKFKNYPGDLSRANV
jgi:hypothetical protein